MLAPFPTHSVSIKVKSSYELIRSQKKRKQGNKKGEEKMRQAWSAACGRPACHPSACFKLLWAPSRAHGAGSRDSSHGYSPGIQRGGQDEFLVSGFDRAQARLFTAFGE